MCQGSTRTSGGRGDTHVQFQATLWVEPTGTFQAQGVFVFVKVGEPMPFSVQGRVRFENGLVGFISPVVARSSAGPVSLQLSAGGMPSPDGRTLSFRDGGQRSDAYGPYRYGQTNYCERG